MNEPRNWEEALPWFQNKFPTIFSTIPTIVSLNNMTTVKVPKAKLLEKLLNNRRWHIELYIEALAGYRKKIIVAVAKELANVKHGRDLKLSILGAMSKPESHADDYDRAIAMLRMSVDETIELTADQFEQLVQDRWGWQNSFILRNSSYSSKIAKLAR